MRNFGNPWIFFSPNNDHPFLSSPAVLDLTIDSATEIEYLLGPENNLCIPYSHFQELQLSASPLRPLWGYYANNFNKILASNE